MSVLKRSVRYFSRSWCRKQNRINSQA